MFSSISSRYIKTNANQLFIIIQFYANSYHCAISIIFHTVFSLKGCTELALK